MMIDRLQAMFRCIEEIQWAINMQREEPKLALLGEMDQREEMHDLLSEVRA
jgi:hypothetical protein